MCPTGEDDEPTGARPQQDWRKAHPEAAAEGRRRYREAHHEELAAAHRAWRERHRERSRELNRESQKRQAQRRRQRLKKNAHQRERREQNPDVARAKSRAFREAHPDKIREYQRRYKERHPERARQSSRESAQRYRDKNAEELRAKQRLAAEERRKKNPDQHKQWYEKHLEEQRARGRDAARLQRRLKKLGLPPIRFHRIYAEERRAHDAAAAEYFARRRDVAERGRIAAEASDADALTIPKMVAARRRVVLREQSTPNNSTSSKWNASSPEGDIPAIVRRWRRARDLQALRETHEALVEKIRAERPQILEHHRERHEARLREEIRLDSIAREVQGLPPYDVDEEVTARIDNEVTLIVDQRLRSMRNRTIARAEDIVHRGAVNGDPAAPHQVPGTRPDVGTGLR
ncbi:hypothetical protein QF046_002953 [Microbacterium sp. W4I4]|uniref:hypothetical protein n=1 Tax=Microbacterium sp. W4I4 TaxID=3042295 RepID=UPI002780496C|nr:hypothetical protein [Microbacterium sp. W4I4]MDQ0615312.1 hypothetical protein [Microbacterium sp. W4I4]